MQIGCLTFIIANPYNTLGISAIYWNGSELILLLAATALSLMSAYNYFSLFMEQFSQKK